MDGINRAERAGTKPTQRRRALKPGLATVALVLGVIAQAANAAGYWTKTGSMTAARVQPTVTLLDSGLVLAAGGDIANPSTSELYDPSKGTWGQVAAMNVAHETAAITRMADGRYLLVDGYQQPAEIYDPKSNRWSLGPALVQPFFNGVTAVTLQDGRVLAIGGFQDYGLPVNVEILDPATLQWSQSSPGNMPFYLGYGFPYGTVLADGRALFYSLGRGYLYTAIFDPVSNQWSLSAPPLWSGTGNFDGGIPPAPGAVLKDGTLLAAGSGGDEYVSPSLTKACTLSQIFDPATGQWTQTASLPTGLDLGLMTALDNGDVLITGGVSEYYILGVNSQFPIGFIIAANTAERWSNSTHKWSYAPHMPGARWGHAAVKLANGNVLVAGGMTTALDFAPGLFLSTAAVYHP